MPDEKQRRTVSLQDLLEAGLIKPPITLTGNYKGHQLRATIDGAGNVTCLGTTYGSLSTAAGVAISSVVDARGSAQHHAVNGWTFWMVQDKDGRLQPIGHLRKRYRETKK